MSGGMDNDNSDRERETLLEAAARRVKTAVVSVKTAQKALKEAEAELLQLARGDKDNKE